MKTNLLLTLILATQTAAELYGAPTDFVVASNLTDSQVSTNAWEGVGAIDPRNNENNVSWGQSFVPKSNGFLTTIDAMVAYGFATQSPPLNVSIYSSGASIPSARLGMVSFAASDFAPLIGAFLHRETFDFSHLHIALETSQEYLIAFETPFGVIVDRDSNPPYYVGWSPASLAGNHSLSLGRNLSFARDGQLWQTTQFYSELGIVVRAIPEPSTLLLAAAGLPLLLRRRRTSAPYNRA